MSRSCEKIAALIFANQDSYETVCTLSPLFVIKFQLMKMLLVFLNF